MDKSKEEANVFYENALNESKKQMEIIDAKIDEELARVKETINGLQEQKKAITKIYDGASLVLGVANEFEDEVAQQDS